MNIRSHRAYDQFKKLYEDVQSGFVLNEEYLMSLDKDILVFFCQQLLAENMSHTLSQYQIKMASNYTVDELIEMFREGWVLTK